MGGTGSAWDRMDNRSKEMQMKKTMVAGLALLVAAGAMMTTGCGKAPEADGRQAFTVGFDAEFPPYGFKDGNEYKGFDLDLAREVCARLDWRFVARPIDWDSKDAELDSGSIDCIWNGFTMQGREDAYSWTPAYVDNSQVVLVRADSDIASLDGLAGKNVAVQTDTPVQKALSAGGDKESLGETFGRMTVTATYNDAVWQLESGAVDAVALDVGVAKQKMNDKPGVFKMLDEIIMTETYGIGFKKGNDALRDQVWAVYQALLADGTVDRIAAEYQIDGVIK